MSDHQNLNQDDQLQLAVNALRQTTVPNGPSPEDVTKLIATLEKTAPQPSTSTLKKRTLAMKSITKMAVAATVLLTLGSFFAWTFSGGAFTSIALANVAEALDSLRSATFDMTSEAKGEKGQPPATATGKGFFLAPSHQRMEISVDSAKITMNHVTIVDGQTGKSITLMPNQNLAVAMDMKKMQEEMKKTGKLPKDASADVFETVRRLVREGSSGTGEKAERLGKKEINGRMAVGFRTQTNMMDMTLWADPETAWPIRVEVVMDMMTGVRMVMNNFRYNVDLDPSLFSLEPPAGYSTQAMEVTMPLEEDLLRTLRTLAEQGKGQFPAKLGMNKEVMEPLMAGIETEMDKRTQDKMNAAMDKIAAKYGGKEKLKAKYGKEIPPAMMAEFTKATSSLMQEQMKKRIPLIQKRMQGITFYMMLKPENDPHYAGAGIKLGTPDRPILWYKPTDAEKYHVIYADLSIQEITPEELKDFPKANDQ